jgi:hypothetical protein
LSATRPLITIALSSAPRVGSIAALPKRALPIATIMKKSGSAASASQGSA